MSACSEMSAATTPGSTGRVGGRSAAKRGPCNALCNSLYNSLCNALCDARRRQGGEVRPLTGAIGEGTRVREGGRAGGPVLTCADSEGGAPLILEDVQADRARLAADVRVPDLRLVLHLWRPGGEGHKSLAAAGTPWSAGPWSGPWSLTHGLLRGAGPERDLAAAGTPRPCPCPCPGPPLTAPSHSWPLRPSSAPPCVSCEGSGTRDQGPTRVCEGVPTRVVAVRVRPWSLPGPWACVPPTTRSLAASCASQHRSSHGCHTGASARACATLRTPLDHQAAEGLRACAPWVAQKGSRPEAECRF